MLLIYLFLIVGVIINSLPFSNEMTSRLEREYNKKKMADGMKMWIVLDDVETSE